MEKLVLVPFEKYQRLQEHSTLDHQKKLKPPPGKRDTSQQKGQCVEKDNPTLKKQTEKINKKETSVRWISF